MPGVKRRGFGTVHVIDAGPEFGGAFRVMEIDRKNEMLLHDPDTKPSRRFEIGSIAPYLKYNDHHANWIEEDE